MTKKTAGEVKGNIRSEAVYSKVTTVGKKKYYMDVKRAKTGTLYLTIKEITIGDTSDHSESRRILVFEKGIKDFVESINEIAKHMPNKETAEV